MKHGFNSNVQLAEALYHVQTEEHGSGNPYIDTVVVSQGRVLHRRRSSYQDLLTSEGGDAEEAALRSRVEQQHHDIVQALRAGSLPLEGLPGTKAAALDIKLRNARSWLAAGRASLEIEVCNHGDGHPAAGIAVEAFIEGVAGEPERIQMQTDAQGRALLEFPLPEIVHPEAAALVIQARTDQGRNQLRYRIKPASSAGHS